MSYTSMADAVADMLGVFRAGWQSDGVALPFETPGKSLKPLPSTMWARWNIEHYSGDQASLADMGNQRLWERRGAIIVQVFTPLRDDVLAAFRGAEIAVNAYQGKRTTKDAWFSGVRINYGPNVDGAWIQTNVVADFVYNQVR